MNGDTSLMNHQSMAIMKEKEGRKLSEITGFVEIMTVQNMDNRYKGKVKISPLVPVSERSRL